MNNLIPKMIHQIWSDVYEPLPKIFQELGDTWKYFHKDWQYVLWDDEKIEQFVNRYFPLCAKPFNSFAYNVQRWAVIRYLILYKMGGLYVDFDYECIDPVEKVLLGNCCFALEPEEHRLPFLDPNHPYFNNAFMAAIPGHPFMKRVINDVFQKDLSSLPENKTRFEHVLCTTGPGMLSDVYASYTGKENIYLIPAEYVSPFSSPEIRSIWHGVIEQDWEDRLQKAVAVHYFMGPWDK